MEQLDDFMKRKFEKDDASERFVFREEYWQQAERLIEADERRRKRRRALWWWLFGAGMLAIVLTGWCWMKTTSPALQPGEQRMGGAIIQEQADTLTTSGGKSIADPNETADRQSLEMNAVAKQNSRETADKSRQYSDAEKTDKNLENQFKIKSTNTKGKKENSRQTPEKMPLADMQSNNGIEPANIVENKTNQIEPATGSNASERTETPAQTDRIEPAPSIAERMAGFDPLPTGIQPLPILLRPTTLKRRSVDLPDDGPVKPAHADRWTWGLAAGGSGYDSRFARERLGAHAGLSLQYPLGRQLALQADLLWRYQPLSASPAVDTLDPNQAFQLKYGFGYTLDEYRLEPRAFHLLELPLALQWRRGPWRAEAGLAPGYLLAVAGRQTLHREDSFNESRRIESKPVRLDAADYRRFYAAAFAGARWEFKPGLQLGLRLHYRPDDLRRAPVDAPAPPVRQRLWLDAGLRWYLFK